MKSIANAKYPMKAVGKVERAGVEFAPGAEFDALTESSRDYLVSQGAAVDLAPTPDIPAVAQESDATSDGSADVVEKEAAPAPKAFKPR